MTQRLTTDKGATIQLDTELGKGGEGSVFSVVGDVNVVAKLYHQPPKGAKAEKLVAMAAGCTDRLRKIAAWPTDTLKDSQGRMVGFLMRRVARHKDIHILYGPKTRLRDYPEKTYAFLVHVAANVARAFAVVHDHGHVIGDVNQGGVCVSTDGLISLVDCDSFQIASGSRVFTCDVGIPIYQPPEFQTQSSYRGLKREANHDCFGLAVLIFQTLFLARHPYAGAYQGDGDMPIEQAIREHRFAYGRDALQREMKQPPGSLGLGSVSPKLALMFERAFLEEGARVGRPSAREWIEALDEFAAELRDCKQNPGHSHWKSLPRCPLCDIEGRIGVLLFVPPRHVSSATGPLVSLDTLWAELGTVVDSSRIPPANSLRSSTPRIDPPQSLVDYQQKRQLSQVIQWAGIAASVFVAAVLSKPLGIFGICVFPAIALGVRGFVPGEGKNARERLRRARDRVDRLLRQVEGERTDNPLFTLLGQAEKQFQHLKGFDQRRAQRLREFEQSRHGRQRQRFLDQFEVKDCGLKGFGPGLLTTLISNGIETADDIALQRLEGIRGFGPKRIEALVTWRRSVETRFVFNASDSADAQERGRLERELSIEYAKELARFQTLVGQIKQAAPQATSRISATLEELKTAQEELGEARSIAIAVGASSIRDG